jgi:hypothetical protein
VRRHAERVLVIAAWHAGGKAIARPAAKGGNPLLIKAGSNKPASLQEMFGSRTRGSRLKRLHKALPERKLLDRIVAAIHGDGHRGFMCSSRFFRLSPLSRSLRRRVEQPTDLTHDCRKSPF